MVSLTDSLISSVKAFLKPRRSKDSLENG